MNPLSTFLFRKERRAYEQVIINNRNETAQAIRKIQDEADRKTKLYAVMKQAFIDFPSGKIIGLEEDKDGNSLAVFEVLSDDSLDIYLYGLAYNTINSHPRIYGEIRHSGENFEHRSLFIDDFFAVDENRGNGAILMDYLIKEAKTLQMESIRGALAYDDRDHFDKLEHFYKKFEFDVKLNETRDRGSIQLKL